MPVVRRFAVSDELMLVMAQRHAGLQESAGESRALVLNASGREIWDLCDGKRSTGEIVDALAESFSVDKAQLREHVGHVLAELSDLGFVEGVDRTATDVPATIFVIGIEDKPYFWWQTAIWLESFRAKLPPGWGTFVVVCNNHEKISPELQRILERYDTPFAEATNHANTNRIDIGKNGGECCAALNKTEALSVAGRTIGDRDLICLIDSDMFLYGPLKIEILPKGCAAARNWHIDSEKFFTTVEKNAGKGIDLTKLLQAMGCEQPFLPGGVNVFVTGAVAKNEKFIADCYRFAHALFLLARAADVETPWLAEMPCFALAMTANGIAYDLLENTELLVSSCAEASIPHGTLYHYYSDPGDFGRFAFLGSKWHKQAYRDEDFLLSDFDPFARMASTDHERYFFQLAKQARARLDV